MVKIGLVCYNKSIEVDNSHKQSMKDLIFDLKIFPTFSINNEWQIN